MSADVLRVPVLPRNLKFRGIRVSCIERCVDGVDFEEKVETSRRREITVDPAGTR